MPAQVHNKLLPQGSLPSPPTKRQRALRELLSSERVYASELVLIHEVHIPLALGKHASFPGLPPLPSISSSPVRLSGRLSPPMTEHDIGIVFGNIRQISDFSNVFCCALAEAVGDPIEGGEGDDRVGALFLSVIPELEQLYKQYIIRYPVALAHLQQLPSTPTVQDYLSYLQSSLLIKPIQRLLAYPLLLANIINEIPSINPDKQYLLEAHWRIEEVMRNSGIKPPLAPSRDGQGETGHAEVILVARLEDELRQMEHYAQKHAKDIVEWGRKASNLLRLRSWSLDFAPVFGPSKDQPSEVSDEFLAAAKKYLVPLCVDFEILINERVSKELAEMLAAVTQPFKLLALMHEQESFHHLLMNMSASSKTVPPSSLLAASANYLALRGELTVELPKYMELLHHGLELFVQKLSAIQTDILGQVHKQWMVLWEMLRVDGSAEYEKDVSAWSLRWSQIGDQFTPRPVVQQKLSNMSLDLGRGSEHKERQREREREEGEEHGTLKEHGKELGDIRPSPSSSSSSPFSLSSFPLPPQSMPPPPLQSSAPLPRSLSRLSRPPPREQRKGPETGTKLYAYRRPSTFTHQENFAPPPSRPLRDSRSTFGSSDATSIYYSDIFSNPSSFAPSLASSSRRNTTARHEDLPEKGNGGFQVANIRAAYTNSIPGTFEPPSPASIAGPPPPVSQRERRSSDMSNAGSANVPLLSSVGLGSGFILNGGGDRRNTFDGKESNESLKIAKGSTHGVQSQTQSRLSTSSTTTFWEQIRMHRKMTEWTLPKQDDLKEYEVMAMGQRKLGRRTYPSKGIPGGGNGNPNGNGLSGTHSNSRQYGHGLPGTENKPLPIPPDNPSRGKKLLELLRSYDPTPPF